MLPSKFSKAFATLGNKRDVLARTIGQFLEGLKNNLLIHVFAEYKHLIFV